MTTRGGFYSLWQYHTNQILPVRKAPKVKGSKRYMGEIITLNEYSAYTFVEFPEFSRQEVCNLLMFDDNFESFD